MRRRVWCDIESGFWEEVSPDVMWWRFGTDGPGDFLPADAEHAPDVLYDDAAWDRYLAACQELHLAKEGIRQAISQEPVVGEEYIRARAGYERNKRIDAYYEEHGKFPEGDEY